MTEKEQIIKFSDDLDHLIDQYRNEFDLTYASVVGALQMKVWTLCREAANQELDPEN